MFQQNERAFRDQDLRSESEQNARAIGLQIGDDIRRSSQGVPVYASSFDSSRTDPVAVVMSGSDSTHLRIREGISNAETRGSTGTADYVIGSLQSVSVADASIFSSALGTTEPSGRFLYVRGLGSPSCWTWIRAELTAINIAANSLTLIPRQAGDACRSSQDIVRFISPQTITLEEAGAIDLNFGSIWRSTATDMTSSINPMWGPASEVGRDVQELTFTYYDKNGFAIAPVTWADRLAAVRVDARIRARHAAPIYVSGIASNALLVRE